MRRSGVLRQEERGACEDDTADRGDRQHGTGRTGVDPNHVRLQTSARTMSPIDHVVIDTSNTQPAGHWAQNHHFTGTRTSAPARIPLREGRGRDRISRTRLAAPNHRRAAKMARINPLRTFPQTEPAAWWVSMRTRRWGPRGSHSKVASLATPAPRAHKPRGSNSQARAITRLPPSPSERLAERNHLQARTCPKAYRPEWTRLQRAPNQQARTGAGPASGRNGRI